MQQGNEGKLELTAGNSPFLDIYWVYRDWFYLRPMTATLCCDFKEQDKRCAQQLRNKKTTDTKKQKPFLGDQNTTSISTFQLQI